MSRTIRSSVGLAAAAVAALGLVGVGAGAAISSPHAHASLAATPTLKVTISKKHFTVAGPKTFQAGRVALTLKSVGGDHTVDVVSFKKGYSYAHLRADLKAFGASFGPTGLPSKAGLKRLNRAVKKTRIYGGLDTSSTSNGTIVLPKAGTYVIYNDSAAVPKQHKTLTVTGPAVKRANPHATATVIATSAKRWRGAAVLPAKGTIMFKNESTNSPHFLVLQHVKEGTTRKQVIVFLNSGNQGNPSFGLPGGTDTDVLGEGNAMTLTYRLPKGEYVEMCFFPDLKTGMPHALMGMVRVVHLK